VKLHVQIKLVLFAINQQTTDFVMVILSLTFSTFKHVDVNSLFMVVVVVTKTDTRPKKNVKIFVVKFNALSATFLQRKETA
jgi:hypothetical protein